jgi:hypothetical protein
MTITLDSGSAMVFPYHLYDDGMGLWTVLLHSPANYTNINTRRLVSFQRDPKDDNGLYDLKVEELYVMDLQTLYFDDKVPSLHDLTGSEFKEQAVIELQDYYNMRFSHDTLFTVIYTALPTEDNI